MSKNAGRITAIAGTLVAAFVAGGAMAALEVIKETAPADSLAAQRFCDVGDLAEVDGHGNTVAKNNGLDIEIKASGDGCDVYTGGGSDVLHILAYSTPGIR